MGGFLVEGDASFGSLPSSHRGSSHRDSIKTLGGGGGSRRHRHRRCDGVRAVEVNSRGRGGHCFRSRHSDSLRVANARVYGLPLGTQPNASAEAIAILTVLAVAVYILVAVAIAIADTVLELSQQLAEQAALRGGAQRPVLVDGDSGGLTWSVNPFVSPA